MVKGLPTKIKELRLKNGYSQKELANKLNVSPSIVSGYETGERTPSIDVLISLSYLFNCSLDYLLGKDNKEPKATIDVSSLSKQQIQAIKQLIKAFNTKQ